MDLDLGAKPNIIFLNSAFYTAQTKFLKFTAHCQNNTNYSENTKSKGRFSALFKSNHETSSTNEDSLQAIYKRLLRMLIPLCVYKDVVGRQLS